MTLTLRVVLLLSVTLYIYVMFFVLFVRNIFSCLLYKIHQPCLLFCPFLLFLMAPAHRIFLHHCANRDEWEKYPLCNG